MEEDKQQQKQCLVKIPEENQPQTTQRTQRMLSTHLNQYLAYFDYTDLQAFKQKRANIYSTLSNSLLFQTTEDFQEKLSIKLVARSPNYEFVQLQVALGNFIFKNVTLANFSADSYNHKAGCNYSGRYCITFKIDYFEQELAFKCFPFPIQNEDTNRFKVLEGRVHAIREAIREYCLSLLASELQSGPPVQKILGFDIAVFQNCIQFPMEFCAHKKQFPVQLDYYSELKKILSSAHLCKLIHYDIKPANICYSWIRRQLVFIDYGFSEFSAVELGQLQYMKFRGSLAYVSKEMNGLFLSKDFGWIDPYYNDLISIKKCISQFISENPGHGYQEGKVQCKEDFSLKYISKKVKCLLYKGSRQILRQLFNSSEYQKAIVRSRWEIIEFDWKLKYPPLFPEIMKVLNRKGDLGEIGNTQNIFCPQPYKVAQQSSPQHGAQLAYQIQFEFLQNNVLCFWRNRKSWQTSSDKQSESLIRINNLDKRFRESYFVLLAEALQINTSKYTLQLRILMAKARLKSLGIQLKTEDKLSQIKRVSVELLQYSLSPPHKKNKLKIYEAILINVVVLKAVSQEALFSYYKRLHSLEVNEQTMLRMVLKFATTYQWMSFTIKSQENYFKHMRKYRDFTLKYLDQLKKNVCKAQIIYFYKLLAQFYDRQIVIFNFQKRQNLQQSYLLNLRNIQDQRLKYIISDWIIFTHSYFRNMSYEDLTICQRILFQKQHNIHLQFEYYHLGLFRTYLDHKNTYKMKSIRKLFLTIFSQLQIHNQYSISSISQILDKLEPINENQRELANSQPEQGKSQLQQPESQLENAKLYIQKRLPQSYFQYQGFFDYIIQRLYNNYRNNHQMDEFYLNLSLFCIFQAQLPNNEDLFATKEISLIRFNQNIQFLNIFKYKLAWKQQYKNKLAVKLKIRYKKQMQVFKKVKEKLTSFQKIVYLNKCYYQLALLLSFKHRQKNDQLYKITVRTSYILRNSLFSPSYVSQNLIFAQNMVSNDRYLLCSENIRIIYNFFHQFPSQRICFYVPFTFARLFLIVLQDYGIKRAFQFYKLQFEYALQIIYPVQQGCQYFKCFAEVIIDHLFLIREVQKQRVFKMMQKYLEKYPYLAIISIPILLCQRLKDRKLLLKLFKSLKHLHKSFGNIVKSYLYQFQIRYYLQQTIILRRLLSIKRKYIKNYHEAHLNLNEKPCKAKEWGWSPVLTAKQKYLKKMHISLIRQKISKIKLMKEKSIFFEELGPLDHS